jgi:tetratricopeptide (TPR) repeat protein
LIVHEGLMAMSNDFESVVVEYLTNNKDPSKFIEILKNDMNKYHIAGGSFFFGVGYIALSEGYLPHAIKSFELALTLEFDKENQKGPALQLLGKCYHDTGEYVKALECHIQALKKGQEEGDRLLIMESMLNIGREHFLLANTSTAKTFFEKSLALALEEKDKVMTVKSYHNLGVLYFDLSDYRKSIEVCSKAIEIKQTIPEVIGETEIIEAECYELIGKSYLKLLMIEQAIEHYEKSLNMYKKIGDKKKVSQLQQDIGGLLNNKTDHR